MFVMVLSRDANGNVLPLVPLNDSHDVNGSSTSAQSNAIQGNCVRIQSLGSVIRFRIGDNPTAVTSDPAIGPGAEYWAPITPGQKVAIIGGQANITTPGV